MSTTRELMRISRGMPKRIADNLIKTTVDKSEEEMARFALKSDKISAAKKMQIAEHLDRGDFRREEKVLDEKMAKEADEYNRLKIKRAIESGKLPDPAKDEFMRKRIERMKNR